MKEYAKITQETPDSVIEGTPVNQIPQGIRDYYEKHSYYKRGIPFSAKTIKEIVKILETGSVKNDKE